MAKWTKKSAISRMSDNKLLQEALQIEPKLQNITKEAEKQRNVREYNRTQKYIELRNRASHLVGPLAENDQLRSNTFYDAVIHTIADLLPPDAIDVDA